MVRKYTEKEFNRSHIYIRIRKDKTVTYVGQCKNLRHGRPFRNSDENAWMMRTGRSEQETQIITIRCPENRLDVREAYFIMKLRPEWVFSGGGFSHFDHYLGLCMHLLKKREVEELKEMGPQGDRRRLYGYEEKDPIKDYREYKDYLHRVVVGKNQ